MSVTNIQGGVTTASATHAFSSNVTAGNLLTARISWRTAGASTLDSVTDSLGNTWTIHADTLAYNPVLLQYLQVASCTSASSGACTITVALSTDTPKAISADEWNNTEGSMEFDVGIGSSGNSDTFNSGDAVTTTDNQLGISQCVANASVGGAFTTPTGGFSDGRVYIGSGAWWQNDLNNPDLGTAGTKSAGEVLASGATRQWGCNIATFKLSGGGGGGTVYEQALAGSLTGAGVLTRRTSKNIAGSTTYSGSVVKLTGKGLSGSYTCSGGLVKQTAKSYTGSLTGTGSLVKATAISLTSSVTGSGALSNSVVLTVALEASMTVAGALNKMTLKALTGASTLAGAITKKTLKALDGDITVAGALSKLTKRAIAGSVTATGLLSESYQVLKSIAGSIAPTGAVTALYIAYVAGVLKLLTMMGVGQ